MIINTLFTLLGVLLDKAWDWVPKKLSARKLKKIFGKDISEEFHMVFGQMKNRDSFEKDGSPMTWPYYKPEASGKFRVSSVISSTTPKCIRYLFGAFNKSGSITPKLTPDIELRNKLDVSFCSIGGFNNLKTIEVLKEAENVFYELKGSTDGIIIAARDGSGKKFSIEENYDYALIVKIIPKSFPDKTWIVIAGLGEWGTTGATWLLSQKWKELPQDKSFGVIVKVKSGQDESAEIVDEIL